MNIYKNGYLAHFLIGIIISLAAFDFGWEWSLALTGIVGAGKELYDNLKGKEVEAKDFLSTVAGGIIGLLIECVESIWV